MIPLLQRPLPSSQDSERAVIGAMLIEVAAAHRVVELLQPDDFYFAAHKVIYSQAVAMLADQTPLDAMLLIQKLRDAGQLDTIGGTDTVTACTAACPSPQIVDHCARIVAGKALQRRLIEHAHLLSTKAYDADDASQLCADAIAGLVQINDATAFALGREKACGFKSMDEMEADFAAFTTSTHTRTLSLHGWLPTLARKAKLTMLVPGEMLVLTGDTGTGKTAWAQNLARVVAPQPVAFFSMELPGTKVFRRFVQLDQHMESEDVWQRYKAGGAVGWDKSRLSHIWTCDESGLTVEAVRNRVQALTKKLGVPPTLTIIDYMGLVAGRGARYEKTSNNAEQLKILAKQESTIVCVLSQVGRPEDKNAQVDPGLHSSKDSGSIESSAGLLLGITRDPKKDGDTKRMRLKVLKQSDGKAGCFVDCLYRGEIMQIEEIAENIPEPNQ